MKLINIDTMKGIKLSKAAESFLKEKFPQNIDNEMYDIDGDMCLDDFGYEGVFNMLLQRDLVVKII